MTSWRGPFEIVEKVTPLTYRLKNVTTGEVYRELSNLNRLALYYPEYKPLLKGGEASERHEVAVGERTNPTTMEHKEEEDANHEEKDRTKNKNQKNRAGEHDSGMEIDPPEGEKAGSTHEEELIALSYAADEGVWLRRLLKEIKFTCYMTKPVH